MLASEMKNKFGLIAGAFVLFGFFAACEHAAPTSEDALQSQDYSYIIEPAARWQAYELKNYSIEQKRVCFCAFPHGFVKLVVKDNKIVEGIDLSTGRPVTNEALQYYQTIDEIFAWIEATKAMNPARFEIEYDTRFGYPKKIAFDYNFGVADDELWIEMQSLKRAE